MLIWLEVMIAEEFSEGGKFKERDLDLQKVRGFFHFQLSKVVVVVDTCGGYFFLVVRFGGDGCYHRWWWWDWLKT
ncbi:hypothetical protein HanRHA438_Chr09g0383521 [Helianthus annuus]|nr:hypothetical protein HanRHA438_Chr09g0383521 [Helianthus annuus]